MVVHPQEVDGILEEGVEVVNASGGNRVVGRRVGPIS